MSNKPEPHQAAGADAENINQSVMWSRRVKAWIRPQPRLGESDASLFP